MFTIYLFTIGKFDCTFALHIILMLSVYPGAMNGMTNIYIKGSNHFFEPIHYVATQKFLFTFTWKFRKTNLS